MTRFGRGTTRRPRARCILATVRRRVGPGEGRTTRGGPAGTVKLAGRGGSTQLATPPRPGSTMPRLAPSAPHSPSAPAPTGLSIPAADGYLLHARLWARPGETSPRRVALVNAGAGIVCAYYERFAAWLAASGTPTLVYDYRGIGGSRPPTLRGFDATVEDWGRLDCSGALAWLETRYPAAERLVVGHSVGGFVTGLSTVGARIDRLLLVGAHSGFYGDYASRARPWMYVLWHVLMPALTRVVGYFPGRRLGLLEDLPRGAALQWAGRRHPDFRDDDDLRLPDGRRDLARGDALHERFRAVRADHAGAALHRRSVRHRGGDGEPAAALRQRDLADAGTVAGGCRGRTGRPLRLLPVAPPGDAVAGGLGLARREMTRGRASRACRGAARRGAPRRR